MPTVALLAREFRKAPFWSSVTSQLVRVHGYIVKDIEKTISTPGDLTFPQHCNLSMLFISSTTMQLDELDVERIRALSRRGRRVVIVVHRDGRNWEQIQSQAAQLSSCNPISLPVVSPGNAACCIQSFLAALTTISIPRFDSRTSAELLLHLNLDDHDLELLFAKTQNLADVATIFYAADRECDWWRQILGETILRAIDQFLGEEPGL